MPRVAPEILRKGAVVRVAGADAASAAALALSYVDLRFPDGHVERWLGPGQFRSADEPSADLRAWGEDVIEVQAEALLEELTNDLGGDFAAAATESFLRCPVETVVEWNAEIDDLVRIIEQP